MSESSLETTGSAQRNQRLALVAVVGVAVIGVIVYLLLFSGGSSSGWMLIIPGCTSIADTTSFAIGSAFCTSLAAGAAIRATAPEAWPTAPATCPTELAI